MICKSQSSNNIIFLKKNSLFVWLLQLLQWSSLSSELTKVYFWVRMNGFNSRILVRLSREDKEDLTSILLILLFHDWFLYAIVWFFQRFTTYLISISIPKNFYYIKTLSHWWHGIYISSKHWLLGWLSARQSGWKNIHDLDTLGAQT